MVSYNRQQSNTGDSVVVNGRKYSSVIIGISSLFNVKYLCLSVCKIENLYLFSSIFSSIYHQYNIISIYRFNFAMLARFSE